MHLNLSAPGTVPVGLVVLGWVVTHALTLRAQSKQFRNQLLDRARMEITTGIREYQDWLSKLNATLTTPTWLVVWDEQGYNTSGPWETMLAGLLDLVTDQDRTKKWSSSLEEYEILYPETRHCRIALLERHKRIIADLGNTHSQFVIAVRTENGLAQRKCAVERAMPLLPFMMDQSALLEDLRIHLQNVSLAVITRKRVPPRVPLDPSLPRLAMGDDGQLTIVQAGEPHEGLAAQLFGVATE